MAVNSLEFATVRAPLVIAVSVAGLVAGGAPARAADLEVETSGYDCCVDYGPEPLVILDNEPGVTIRRWWLPPWRNRHYYPHGRWAANKPTSSADADAKPVARQQPRRARSYRRYWSNSSVYAHEPSLIGADTPLPRDNPYRNMPPVVFAPVVR